MPVESASAPLFPVLAIAAPVRDEACCRANQGADEEPGDRELRIDRSEQHDRLRTNFFELSHGPAISA